MLRDNSEGAKLGLSYDAIKFVAEVRKKKNALFDAIVVRVFQRWHHQQLKCKYLLQIRSANGRTVVEKGSVRVPINCMPYCVINSTEFTVCRTVLNNE